MERGTPKAIHIAVVIAAPEGIAYLEQHLPDHCHLWIADLDEKLNEHSYPWTGRRRRFSVRY
jgi:uracil phosphoribosyltransferase